MIYEPAEDSFLLKSVLEKEIKTANSVLEIGIGSGYLSESLANVSKSFVGVDINQEAVTETQKRVNGTILQSDLFSNVPKKRYDVVVFNPPYLPKHKADGEEAVATVGGKHGYEVILRFIRKLSDFLHPNGSCYLLFSSLSKPPIIFQELEQNLFVYEKVAEISVMMEGLFVYKITPNSVLQNLMEDITQIRYLSKGKRSIVLKGTYKKNAVAIKVLNNTTTAIATIDRESENLKFVNTLGIGPMFIAKKKNYVIMEFISGESLQNFSTHASKEELRRVLLEVLLQCHQLDLAQFQKEEMTRPYKHVIIGESVTLIDFEKGYSTKKPSNVTQFLQFLHASKFSALLKSRFNCFFSREKLSALAKEYDFDAIKMYLIYILS